MSAAERERQLAAALRDRYDRALRAGSPAPWTEVANEAFIRVAKMIRDAAEANIERRRR